MKYTIEDLRNGKCAVKNDGTLEELREVLRLAFPKDDCNLSGTAIFYFKNFKSTGEWDCTSNIALPIQSVKDFLEPQFTRGDIVEVSNHAEGWERRIYLTTVEGAYLPHVVVNVADEEKYTEGDQFGITTFRKIREVGKEKIVELTMEDISEGKGRGIPPYLIRIKK